MYLFELVCIVSFLLITVVDTADNKKKCARGEIPVFCTKHGHDSDECVKDNRNGMDHGHWNVDFKGGKRCILTCDSGYIPSGCHVQRKWTDNMPTCIEHQNKLDDKFSTFGLLGGVVAAGLAVTGLLGVIPALVPAAVGIVGLPYLSDACEAE
ncbi:uncharacterized protein LOC132732895 [Ruditapes philippinarum]|uniref:uncharacterized protein LOC132732895 n=1 Tax=Ruditapes philippinarum TaxID=129788 RepID=UPI00295AE55A|nr:uncharacterized protein LOC132732895 [Ruditapes philippinarum]